MAHYKAHALHTLEEGFIVTPSYMNIHLSYELHNVPGQLQTSSYELEIEVGIYAHRPLEERIRQWHHRGVESKEQMFANIQFSLR